MFIVFQVLPSTTCKQRKRYYQFTKVLSSIQQMCFDSWVVILVEALPKSEPIWAEAAPDQKDAKGQTAGDIRWFVVIWIIVFEILRSDVVDGYSEILKSCANACQNISKEEIPESNSAKWWFEYFNECQQQLISCSSIPALKARLNAVK